MQACKFNTINAAVTEVDHLRKNHLQLVSNGKVDEKAEEERRSLIKSMSRRSTPNAVSTKWNPVEEKSTTDILSREAPRSSALRSLQLFEKRKSLEKNRQVELQNARDHEKQLETERRKARRQEFIKKYSNFDSNDTTEKPKSPAAPRRKLSERVEAELQQSQGPSQVSLPLNNTPSIASTEPPSSPLKSTTPVQNSVDDTNRELEDFSEKIAEDINSFKRRSRDNSENRTSNFEPEFDITGLSKSGQAILRYGSVSEREPSRSSSRGSVSDRLKRFEILDATANNEKDVLNNPRKSVRKDEF